MSTRKPPVDPDVVPENESSVKSLIAGAQQQPYVAVASLAQAREREDAVVVFEGDYGGQVYVVAPISPRQVHRASPQALSRRSRLDRVV